MAESNGVSDDGGDDVLSQSSDDSSGVGDDSDQEGEGDETNVEISMDVIFDEEDSGDAVNESSQPVKHSNHQIALSHYATSNPILLIFLVLLTAAVSFRRQL